MTNTKPNHHAVALARLARNVPKKITRAESKRRKQRMAYARQFRHKNGVDNKTNN